MERIEVGRYENSSEHGWAGWIRPSLEGGKRTCQDVPEWTLFITTDGEAFLGKRVEVEIEDGQVLAGLFFGEDTPVALEG